MLEGVDRCALASLRRDGYCVLKHALPSDAIDAHVAAYTAAAVASPGLDPGPVDNRSPTLPPDGPERVAYFERLDGVRQRRHAFQSEDRTHLRLAFDPTLVAFATAWFHRDPVMLNPSTTLYSRGSHLHADTLNSASTDPWEDMLRCWCALEDIDPRSGPMAVYPASHRAVSGVVREQLLQARPADAEMLRRHLAPENDENKAHRFEEGARMYRALTRQIGEMVRRQGLPAHVPSLSKGDVLVFNPAIVHESTDCQDPQRTRKSFLFTYCALGATWFSGRAYWGALHDHRCPENAMSHAVEHTPFGLRVTRYLETLKAYERRPMRSIG